MKQKPVDGGIAEIQMRGMPFLFASVGIFLVIRQKDEFLYDVNLTKWND